MWTDESVRLGRVLWLLAGTAACATGAPRPTSQGSTMRPLEEVRAVRVLEDAVRVRGLRVEHERSLRLPGNRVIITDVALAGTRHAIEYVTESDRERAGASLPTRRSPGALVMAAGVGTDQGADCLVLEASEYQYETDPDRTGPGHPGIQEVEDRLHRAVVDWLSWLRGQGRL